MDDSSSSKRPCKRQTERYCEACKISIPANSYTGHIRSAKHKQNVHSGGNCGEDGVSVLHSAFKNRIISYKIVDIDTKKQFQHANTYLNHLKVRCLRLLKEQLQVHNNLKVNLELFGLYYLPSKEIEERKSFLTRNRIISQSDDLEEIFEEFIAKLDEKTSEFAERDSGWALQYFTHLEVNINKFNPLRGSTYVKLPPQIENKKAVLNIQNADEKCFLWCILAHLHPVSREDHPYRVNHYVKYENELNIRDLQMPLCLKDIQKFETLNNNISVNVYGLDYQRKKYEIVGPLYYTRQRKNVHVNLLLIVDDKDKQHYCLIRNISRLLSSQINSRDHALNFCDGCLNYFPSFDKLEQHQSNDCTHVYTSVPTTNATKLDHLGDWIPENILKFDNFKNKFKAPFVIYCDFESLLQPIEHIELDQETSTSFTLPIAKHVPYSVAYYIKCSYDDNLSKFFSYRGLDCSKVFNEKLTLDVKNIWLKYLKDKTPLTPLNKHQEYEYYQSKNCHICDKPFIETDDVNKQRVRDHSYTTGEFRGAAHSICNLQFKPKNYIPCFFHNLTNYDAHLFIKDLGVSKDRIHVIGKNKEKYICFSKQIPLNDQHLSYINIKFLDSYRFLPSSLDQLSRNLKSSQCRELRRFFPNNEDFNLLKQKGVFPYSFVDSMEKLSITSFPTHEQFFDKLHERHIDMSEYNRGKQVWNQFNCDTLGDYSDLYLKCDVLLLTDVFENYRDLCLSIYELDPTNYPTAPSLAWDAMLKYTKVELELLTDVDMINFLKKGIRGGISQCSVRRAVANNPFVENYDSSKPINYLTYLDMTNLYGAAMSQPLPTSNFSWLTDEEIKIFDINSLSDDFGYILEVDITYPDTLHDLHNDLPFCVESITPPHSNSKSKKLIPNLYDKSKYVIHYKNLLQAISHGLILTKIHRVLRFNQSCWLKTYIDLNTEHRNKATGIFEKNNFKGMNNSAYGKTMENVENRVDIRLVTHWENIANRKGAESLIAKPEFKNCSIFSENLIAIEMGKTKVCLNKPIYLGFCILEISKYMMYEFYYNFIKYKYGDKASLLYMDTDSFIMQIETFNFYNDMKENIDKFDTSNFPLNNIHSIPNTISIIGKMKDEYAGQILYEFIGTGAKAYAVDVQGKVTAKAKGVPHYATSKLTMDTYRNIVDNADSKHYKTISSFRSRLHVIYTEIRRKVALSYFDDKRLLIPNSYRTQAWGHKDNRL